jgi:uracil-DNA glycosylase
MTQDQLRSYLEYYRDLGFDSIYRPAGVVAAAVAAEPVVLPAVAPSGDTLSNIRADIGDCRRCRLCEGRQTIVFGSGNEQSKLVFVGEGPGADEDEQGLPFCRPRRATAHTDD